MNGRQGNGSDGRHIDDSVGRLEGEGSQQLVGHEDPASLQPLEVWGATPGVADDRDGGATYYDRPVIKEPVWIWAVPAYFYVGGAAGAAVVLGEAVESLGRGEVDGLVRKARWIGAVGGATGSALLIYDLGRPERFLHMLRVWRPTSPMSVGSWVLAAASPIFAASALLPHVGGVWGRAGNVAGKAAAALGLPLAGYTAVLLSNTAVPLWQEVRRSLPYLFVASAAASAAALLEMTTLNEREQGIVRRFGTFAQTAELVAAHFLERDARRIERVGLALESGMAARLWKTSKAATVTGVVVRWLPGRTRASSILSGALGSVAGVAIRFALFHAGKASARDPRASFDRQRAGRGAAAIGGQRARTPPAPQP
ncbi:polysulfide reductase NrfD [soil metagenome]